MVGRFACLALAGCGRIAFDASPDVTTEFRDLCRFPRVTVIENGIELDDVVGASLSSQLRAGCQTTPTTRTVSQDDPGILDPRSDRPLLSPDELAVIGGGDGPNRAIAYLLKSDTPIIWAGGKNTTIRERSTGRTIVKGSTSSTHDYALIMAIAEPISGGSILSAQGLSENGTDAASRWFTTQIAPMITTTTDSWMVVEWTETDSAPGPSAGDAFTVIESGR